VERGSKVIVLMPGVPVEMTYMWEHEVEPELERRADSVLVSRTLKTLGVGEGTVDERVSPLLSGTNPSIGVYARADGVHLRISAKARTRAEAERLIEPVEAEARRLLGPIGWGVDDDSLAMGVGRMLRERHLTLALMESATGGGIGNALTAHAGASDFLKGSLVTYATEVKVLMGVPQAVIDQHGVISRATAEAMAAATRERLSADIGLGITGIAGDDPIEDQPPGTMHIAVTDGTRTEYVHSAVFQGRDAARQRAVTEALGLLRTFVMSLPADLGPGMNV
jgi:nicotinamide-nucleotide amidase